MVYAMKLADKGRYAPPPQLGPSAQSVAETVARWPGVQARAHWLLGDERRTDGTDFYFVEEELGHIHLDSVAHVIFPRPIVDTLVEARLGRRFQLSDEVVAFEIRNQSAAAHAVWLVQLSYDLLKAPNACDISARIISYLTGSSQTSRGSAARSRG